MIQQQKNIINAYNKYLKNKAIYNAMATKPTATTETVCTSYSCGCKTVNNRQVCTPSLSSTVSISVYKKEITYDKIECDYDSSTGKATCSKKDEKITIEVKETYNNSGEAKTSTGCGEIQTSCGTKGNDLDSKWTSERDKYSNFSSHLTTAKGNSETLKDIIANYKSCYNWTNNYCFDPKVEFSYEDGNVYTEVNNQQLQAKGDVNKSPQSVQYYNNVNNEYEGNAISINEQNINYVYVKGANDYESSASIDFNIKYVKSEVTASKSFSKGSVKVCTYHPYGTILTGNSCNGSNITMLGNDGYVFPVSLEKNENRLYNYDLKFSNIGVAGNDATCDSSVQTNRLMGCNTPNDVYTTTTLKSEPKYTCQYGSCPECQVECVCPDDNPGCYVEDNICKYIVCNDCTVECVGCLWNDGDAAFSYKQVSLSDVFPNSNNNEDVGYNWNTNASVNPQADKATKTISQIEKDSETGGEKVYTTPEYSYTLTPATLNKIRLYNEAANGDIKKSLPNFGEVDIGGYSNDTLICGNGNECKSSFLNGLDGIVGKDNRIRNTVWATYSDGSAWK